MQIAVSLENCSMVRLNSSILVSLHFISMYLVASCLYFKPPSTSVPICPKHSKKRCCICGIIKVNNFISTDFSRSVLAKWLSLEDHVHNKHKHKDKKFPKCAHGKLRGADRNKKWFQRRKYCHNDSICSPVI